MAVAFSPDGKTLASVTREYDARGRVLSGEMKLWDVDNHQERGGVAAEGAFFGLAFSPTGDTLATGGMDGTVSLWEVPSGKRTATLTGHSGIVHALAFAADGRTLATGGADRTVRIWDTAGRKERQTLRGHMDEVVAVAISADGRTLVSSSVDQTVTVWDVTGGQADT
jgi:WD40 repeat protein